MFDVKAWRNLKNMTLEDIAAEAERRAPPGPFKDLLKWALPIFQTEDFNYHASAIVEKDARVRSYVVDSQTGQVDEENFKALYNTAEGVYQGFKWQRRLAKAVDTADHVVPALAAIVPMPGTELKAQFLLDIPLKFAYIGYYLITTKDLKNSLMFAAVEAGSMSSKLSGFIAPIMDLPNMYNWGTTNKYQELVADAYVNLMSRTAKQRQREEQAHAEAPYERPRDDRDIVDAEFVDLPDDPADARPYGAPRQPHAPSPENDLYKLLSGPEDKRKKK